MHGKRGIQYKPTSDLTLPQPVYKEEEQGEGEYGGDGTGDEPQTEVSIQVMATITIQYGVIQTDELTA